MVPDQERVRQTSEKGHVHLDKRASVEPAHLLKREPVPDKGKVRTTYANCKQVPGSGAGKNLHHIPKLLLETLLGPSILVWSLIAQLSEVL